MTFNPNLVLSANMKSMLSSWSHGPCLLSEWGWLYTVDMLVFFVFEFFYDANMLIALSFVSCDTFFWVHCLTQNRPICVIPFQVMFSWFRCFQAVKPGMPFGESEACKACTSTYWMWWYMHFILFFFFLFAIWEHYSRKTCHDCLNTHVNKTHAIAGEMLPGISIHKKQLILQWKITL